MHRLTLFLLPLLVTISACIGDDYVDDYVQPELRLSSLVDTIEVGSTHSFAVTYFNNIGAIQPVVAEWSSSAPDVITVDENGTATAHAEGSAMITASYEEFGEQTLATHRVYGGASTVIVEEDDSKGGTVATTSSYILKGEFNLISEGEDLMLTFGEDYEADTGLPGLYIYLSNNPNSIGDALEIAAVTVFSGAHDYRISGVSLDDYSYVLYFCKPFNVEVGSGRIE